MSTSDLRGVGISAPTGFVHVSGYNRNFGRCGSVSESTQSGSQIQQNNQMNLVEAAEKFVKSQQENLDAVNNPVNLTSHSSSTSQPPSRDHSSCRSRMRELSNIDPKFTSQVGQYYLNISTVHIGAL